MLFKRTLAAGALALMGAVGAHAADLPVTVPTYTPPVVTMPTPTFNWGGVYVGAFGGYTFGLATADIGMLAGYNFVSGNFLAGAEARVGVGLAGPAFFGSLNARAGYIVSPNLLLYGVGGVGYIPAVTTVTYTFGGGAEFAINNNLSVFGEARGLGAFGGGCCLLTLQTGLSYHIGH